MGIEHGTSRRHFLRGATAASLLANAPVRADVKDEKTLIIGFAGLCAFVVTKDSIVVTFPDAHDCQSGRPAHGAAMARFAVSKGGELYEPSLVVPLRDVHLKLASNEGPDGTIDAITHLVSMTAAGMAESGMVNPDGYDEIHPSSLYGSTKVAARFELPKKVVLSVTPIYKTSCDGYLKKYAADTGSPITVADELQLKVQLPKDAKVSLEAANLEGFDTRSWVPVTDKDDKESLAGLLFMNLPMAQPIPDPREGFDLHFLAYYELCRQQPAVKRLPWYPKNACPTGRGGYIPRCAMALFNPPPKS